ncbi:hypothetical protein MRX96_025892 [Rhipicephalus microplus]
MYICRCISFYSLAKSPKRANVSPGLLEALLSEDHQLSENEAPACDDVTLPVEAAEVAIDHADYVEERSDDRLTYYIAGYVVEQASENELAASILLEQVKKFQKVKAAVDDATEILQKYDKLKCATPGHHEKLLEVVLVKFLRPLFGNFTTSVTDKHNLAKDFHVKPLSRKVLKL